MKTKQAVCKLFIVVNVDSFFLSHRLPIALAAKNAGSDVTILSLDTGCREEIESYGFRFIDIPFQRSGSNPLHEFKCICLLKKIYKAEKPNVIHQVTLKACLLGSVAAKWAKMKNVVNAISGFGYIFTDGRAGVKVILTKRLMKLAFTNSYFHYIFQNPDDINQFTRLGFSQESHFHLIKGSGVDLDEFMFTPLDAHDQSHKVKIVLPARMLYDKGIVEFVEAAKKIKPNVHNKAEFLLVGNCDLENLAGIPEDILIKMTDSNYIQWLRFQKNIIPILQESDIVVLPSYREGLPKSLIEACAIGRPIVTTDTQGCRECVNDEYNGFLVPVKNIDQLAEKMELLINDFSLRVKMGKNGRLMAEEMFSITSVVKSHLNIYGLLQNR